MIYTWLVSCQHADPTCGRGGVSCFVLAGGDTASGASGLRGCVLGSSPCGVSLPKRSAQRLDCCHLVWWSLLESFYGICKTACGLQYAIGGRYGWERDCMMLVSERVRDAFTSRVFHDDTNATVVGGGMGEIPCFGGMITPGFALAGCLMHKDLCAERCHQRGIK
jgi:hypothetical protein